MDENLLYILRTSLESDVIDEETLANHLVLHMKVSYDFWEKTIFLDGLSQIKEKRQKIFMLLEKVAKSDPIGEIRYLALKKFISLFEMEGIILIEWVIENEQFPLCLILAIKFLDQSGFEKLNYLVKKALINLLNMIPDEMTDSYFFDLKRLFRKKKMEEFTLEEICKIFLNLRTIMFLNKIYQPTEHHENGHFYTVSKGIVTGLELIDLKLEDLKQVAGIDLLSELRSLDLSDNNIEDITHLENFPKLITLKFGHINFIDGNKIREINGLDTLIELELLSLNNNFIAEIKNLDSLTKIKYLYLKNNEISEIKNLDQLMFLEHLDLQMNKLKEIKGLENQTNLEELILSRNEIIKIDGLENQKNLESLNLDRNNITEIKGLSNLTSLKYLYLNYNQINLVDWADFLPKLEIIDLSFNNISQIGGLNNLPNLSILQITGNPIERLVGFENNQKPLFLHVDINQVYEIENIESIKKVAFCVMLPTYIFPIAQDSLKKFKEQHKDEYPFSLDFIKEQEKENRDRIERLNQEKRF